MKSTRNKAVYEQDINEYKGKANSIVFPDSIEEIKTLVKLSNLDIIPRGSGVNFTGATVPNSSVIVDMSKMNNILEIDKQRKLAYVEAGILISELNQELAKSNLELPVEPILHKIRTVGGLIATNAEGSREIKYGRIKNWIDSLEVVNGKGELIEVPKTDTSDFVGLEGTTGIIVRAKLRLTTKKQRTFSILKSASLAEIFTMARKLKLDHEVSMLYLFGPKTSVAFDLENKYHLFIEFESNRGNMKDENYIHFLNIKNKAYNVLASKGYSIIENPRFFMDKLPDFIVYLEQNNIPYFCNLSSGTVYPCFRQEEPEKRQETLEIIRKLRARISDGFGIGLTKKEFLDLNEKKLIKRVKQRQDPEWKFNGNKLIDYEAPPKQEEPELKLELEPEPIPELKSEKTPTEEIEEFIEEQKVEEILHAKPIQETKNIDIEDMSKEEQFKAIDENITLEKEDKMTKEEEDEVKRLAGGYSD